MIDEKTAAELFTYAMKVEPRTVSPMSYGRFSESFIVGGPPEATGSKGAPLGYVLRVAPPDSLLQLFYEYRMMRQEPEIHCRVRAETTVPVPRILAHDFSRELIDRDYLVMERLDGHQLTRLGPSAIGRAMEELGGYVAQLHGVQEPQNRFGYVGAHNCMPPQPDWQSAFFEMYRRLLDDIVETNIYDRETADWALSLLHSHAPVFEHAEVSRLCHGDLWVENVLATAEGEVSAVLDFDRACWGDIEWDLAIADYCGMTREEFWRGYGQADFRRDRSAEVRRLFYLLYEHQKYIVISMSSRRNDPQGARRYADQSQQIMRRFKESGRVDI
ncbi:MAG: aminoglycoside phosphotransferase family protein [Spirochaetia bacterium]|nr:aminoglycoside phosphotransferase family protein [Spirochaetia bacterium]